MSLIRFDTVSLRFGDQVILREASFVLEEGERVLYRPCAYTRASLHYARSTAKVELWRDLEAWLPLPAEGSTVDWGEQGEFAREPVRRRLHKVIGEANAHVQVLNNSYTDPSGADKARVGRAVPVKVVRPDAGVKPVPPAESVPPPATR